MNRSRGCQGGDLEIGVGGDDNWRFQKANCASGRPGGSRRRLRPATRGRFVPRQAPVFGLSSNVRQAPANSSEANLSATVTPGYPSSAKSRPSASPRTSAARSLRNDTSPAAQTAALCSWRPGRRDEFGHARTRRSDAQSGSSRREAPILGVGVDKCAWYVVDAASAH